MLRRLGLLPFVLALAACLPAVASAATYPGVTDMGSNEPSGPPVRVGSTIEVPVFGASGNGGVWANGVVTTPSPPASDPNAYFTIESVNSSGVAVGDVTTGLGKDVPGYWNPASGNHFTEVDVSGLSDGQAAYSAVFTSIDSAGDAVGNVFFYDNVEEGLYVSGTNGVPTGTPQAVASLGGASITGDDSTETEGIARISTDYEVVESTSSSCNCLTVFDYNRHTGTVADTGLGFQWNGQADDGDVVGGIPDPSAGGSATIQYARYAPGQSQLDYTAPAGSTVGVVRAINSSGTAIGQINTNGGSSGELWDADGTPSSLMSQVANAGGFTVLYPTYIDEQGDIVGSGISGGSTRYFLLGSVGTKVSGTAYDAECTEESCSQVGLPGLTVLVKGTSSSGAAVSQTATTAAGGTWSVSVPPGTYQAGPSEDGGATIDDTGFDPGTQPVSVGSSPVSGINFATCATDGGDVQDDVATMRIRRPAASSAAVASQCKSIYTVDLSAKLPSGPIVDPSTRAHYNTSSDPNRAGYNTSTGFKHSGLLRKVFNFSPEFPACLSAKTVAKLTRENASSKWYDYLLGGSLGEVKVPFVWNRHTQQVNVEEAPTVTTGTVTRVFKYELKIHGKTSTGQCKQTGKVPVEVLAVGGGDMPSALAGNQFSLIATWGVPFDPIGTAIDPEGTTVQRLYGHVADLDEKVEELTSNLLSYASIKWKQLPEAAKFVAALTVGQVLGEIGVGVVKLGPAAVDEFFAGAKYFNQVVGGAKLAVELSEYLHKAKTAQEVLDFLGAYGGEYPVFSAVIRGRFTSTYTPLVLGGQRVPAKSILALSASTTKFPDFTLKLSRNAQPNQNSSDPTVFNGQLPWTLTANGPEEYNPFADGPANQINAVKERRYDSGREAIEHMEEDTKENEPVAKAIESSSTLADNFGGELASAPQPACDAAKLTATTPDTICWIFSDFKP